MKQLIRGFSIGLFTAAILLGVIYFTDTEQMNSSTADTVNALEEDGYFVYEQNMAEQVNNLEEKIIELENEEEAQFNNDQVEENAETEDLESVTITIEPGMSIQEIINLLTEEEILTDEEAFINYLQEQETSRYIQVGEFTLHKQMNPEEIAAIITGQEEAGT